MNYRELITESIKITKPRTKDIFDLLTIEISKAENEKEVSFDRQTLVKLLSYFIPKPRKLPKSTFEWVAKATSKKKEVQKPCLNYVYCDGSYIIGCDRYRMHKAPCGDRAVGYYCPNTAESVNCEYKYPVEILESIAERAKTDSCYEKLTLSAINHCVDTHLPINGKNFTVKFVKEALAYHKESQILSNVEEINLLYMKFQDGCSALIVPQSATS